MKTRPNSKASTMPGPESRAEADLIDRIMRRDVDAAEQFARRHWPGVHRIAVLVLRDQHLAEDLAQEVILEALSKLDGFDRAGRIAPWIHRITTNRAIDRLRSPSASREKPVDPADNLLGGQPEPTVLTSDRDLAAALGSLSPDEAAAVILRYSMGYSAGEVAEMTSEPVGTVRSRCSRALQRLRQELASEKEASHG